MEGHVVVVGAGVIGLCTALYCAQRGWRVSLVERHTEHRDGCSFGNTGMIVPSHFVPLAAPGMVSQALKWMLDASSPFYVRPRASWDLIDWSWKFWRASCAEHVDRAGPLLRDLSLASLGCYEALPEADSAFRFERTGVLVLCRTQHALDEEAVTAKRAQALGLFADVLDARATAALEPGVRMDVAGAVHFVQDCNIAPEHFIAVLQRRLTEHGARFVWNAEATGWRVDRSDRIRALKLNGGEEIEADEFVLATGVWSPGLARSLGLRIPLQAGKGYSLTLTNPRWSPAKCAILSEARVAVSPMGNALRFGGTMELCGLDEAIDRARVRSIIDAVQRYYPDFTSADFENVQPWRGLRPCSPDGLPYIGRTSRHPNLLIATGHAMMGISLGPITGQLVAQIVSGERPDIDLALLSPDRYH